MSRLELNADLQKLEGKPPVFSPLEPEAPWLPGTLPGQADVDEALGALPEQLSPGVDNVVYWDLHLCDCWLAAEEKMMRVRGRYTVLLSYKPTA